MHFCEYCKAATDNRVRWNGKVVCGDCAVKQVRKWVDNINHRFVYTGTVGQSV